MPPSQGTNRTTPVSSQPPGCYYTQLDAELFFNPLLCSVEEAWCSDWIAKTYGSCSVSTCRAAFQLAAKQSVGWSAVHIPFFYDAKEAYWSSYRSNWTLKMDGCCRARNAHPFSSGSKGIDMNFDHYPRRREQECSAHQISFAHFLRIDIQLAGAGYFPFGVRFVMLFL